MIYKILIINGPNLNMLGKRESSIYGRKTLDELVALAIRRDYGVKIKIESFQSNHEGVIIDKIHNDAGKHDLIIVNAGGLTHTSVSLRDAFLSVETPFIETHISNIFAREEFRRHSLLSDAAAAVISGGGKLAYALAIEAGLEYLKTRTVKIPRKSKAAPGKKPVSAVTEKKGPRAARR